MAVVALLVSPLLGPSSWRAAAAEFERRGHTAHVCATTTNEPRTVLAEFAESLPAGEIVLVPHSNAGAYVPRLTTMADVRGAVFVDAILPPPTGTLPLAAPALVEQLRPLAGADGMVPPWTAWWPDDLVDGLFTDPDVRASVESEQRRLPLAYFTGTIDVPAGWDELPCAYLALSAAYEPNLAAAAARGWPVSALGRAHLHQTVDPPAVVDAIEHLLELA